MRRVDAPAVPKGSGPIDQLLKRHYVLEGGETIESVRNIPVREQIMALLEECNQYYEKKDRSRDAKLMSMINKIFDLLNEYFLPTVPPPAEEMLAQIRTDIFNLAPSGNWRDPSPHGEFNWSPDMCDWRECYNSTFAVYVVRIALKEYRLPIIFAKGWSTFAKDYTALVLNI